MTCNHLCDSLSLSIPYSFIIIVKNHMYLWIHAYECSSQELFFACPVHGEIKKRCLYFYGFLAVVHCKISGNLEVVFLQEISPKWHVCCIHWYESGLADLYSCTRFTDLKRIQIQLEWLQVSEKLVMSRGSPSHVSLAFVRIWSYNSWFNEIIAKRNHFCERIMKEALFSL